MIIATCFFGKSCLTKNDDRNDEEGAQQGLLMRELFDIQYEECASLTLIIDIEG